MGKAFNLWGINIAGDVFRFAFFRKNNGTAKDLRRNAGYTYPRSFDSKNFCDIFRLEKSIKLPCHFAEERNVHLVIQKVINFENAPISDFSVPENSLLKKSHSGSPLKIIKAENDYCSSPLTVTVYIIPLK